MSGGHFNYIQDDLLGIAEDLQILIDNEGEIPENNPDWYRYDFAKETVDKLQETCRILVLAAKMLRRVDWLVSADDGEDSFHRRWAQEGLPQPAGDK